MVKCDDTLQELGKQVPEKLTPTQLRWVKGRLGLTWDDLAALVGVTPRLVYKWNAGESQVPVGISGFLWYECLYGMALSTK